MSSEAGDADFPLRLFFIFPLDIRSDLIYYYVMIKFDDPQTLERIKQKKLYDKINVAFFTAFISFLIISAVVAHYFGELGIWFLCASGCILVALILYNVLIVAHAGKLVKAEITRGIAQGFYANEEFLKGEEIAFTVDYEGDTLTVKRSGFSGRIALDPSSVKDGQKLAVSGGEIKFDLSALKSLHSVYSLTGSYIWDFLNAYYGVNSERQKFVNIRVTDNTCKHPLEFDIVNDGDLICGTTKNYFVKTGLVK